jgi:hypothetical protein
MARNPNIAVITIGYNKYAFEDIAQALELMAILSKAVMVDDSTYSLNKHEVTERYFLADSEGAPELKFAATNFFNTHETVKEAKERLDREKKDREDMEQDMQEGAVALPAPAPSAPIDDDFCF